MRNEIIVLLQSYPNSITARRWLKSEAALQKIEECHTSWNEDHEIMGYPDMIYSLETHIEIYLDQPFTIDDLIK